jgi:transcriptional regulator with XRE-family HTH domain
LTGTYKAREAFGTRLRRLRERSGLNGKQLAAALSWPHSKVSKIELGRQRPTVEDVTAWVGTTSRTATDLEELLADLRNLRVESTSWARQLRGGHSRRQQANIRLEASASSIRAFEPAVIPGLLQTADYARSIMTRRAALHGLAADVEAGVGVRMQRQHILYDADKRLRFLVTEASICYQPCSIATLRGQLDRLLAVAGLETIELAIIPFHTELPMTTSHGFWIFDSELVLVETLSSEISLRDREDIELYERHFEALWEVALSAVQTRRLLAETIARLSSPEPQSADSAFH